MTRQLAASVFLIAALGAGWSALGGDDRPGVVYQVDFGPAVSCAQGFLPVESHSSDERFFWKGRGLGMRDRGGDDLLNRDFVEGERAELTVGLDNGRYEVEITFGDQNYAHGPFNVLAQGQFVAEKLTTPKGKFVTKAFPAEVTDERLRIEIVPVAEGANFAATSLVVRGPSQRGAHRAIPPGPPKEVPTLAEIDARGRPDPAKTLKLFCDWLVAHQMKSGSLNPNSAEWYRSAYPARTLLAGYDIFGERKYLDAVTLLLDKLVGEQLPNGAWSSGFSNKPVAQRTKEQIARAQGGTTNTADVGSISTCLAVAYPYVDDARKKVYRDALRRFSDEYAAQWQLPSGGFTNGRWAGTDMTVPYSVATGTQGMSFCALHAITGERKYLETAQRAAAFLLDNWQPDGRPIHHHHAQARMQVLDVTHFGDLCYYHEALLWVWHWTADEALQAKIRQVYAWHIKGERGLLAARAGGVWWPPADPWTNSKAAAMPLVLLAYDRSMAHDPEVAEAVRRATVFLCTPDFAARIGILCDPDMPWGLHATTATGFAGLVLAELTKPGVVFLKSDQARP